MRPFPSIAGAVALIAAAAPVPETDAALNAYLTIAADTRIEVAASAWGRSSDLEPGRHIDRRPPRGVKAVTLMATRDSFELLQAIEGDDAFGGDSTYVTLTIEDTEGPNRRAGFMGMHDFICEARSRSCGFVYSNVEWTTTR